MANVKFLRGTQANLNTLIGGSGNRFTEGAFYLTTDTDRLYVAQSASELVLLNSIVKHVSDVDHLPSSPSIVEVGDFYYAESENILCVRTSAGWQQINRNTTIVSDDDCITIGDAAGGGVSVTVTVTDNSRVPNVVTGDFVIKGTGTTSVTQSNGVITINGAATANTTYDLSAASGNKIRLTDSSNNNDDVTIAGSGKATVSTDTSTNTITVNVPVATTEVEQSFSSAGVLTTVVTDSHATTSGSDTVTPIIKLGDNATEYKFIGSDGPTGIATLPVYTKTEVETKISQATAAMDAMTYKGTVDSSSASTKLVSTANVGDTYKASSNLTAIGGVSGNDAKVGDLIIAEPNGQNGGDGNVIWTVVPSGNDQTITVEVDTTDNGTANGLTISDNGIVQGGIDFTAGTESDNKQRISVSSSQSGSIRTVTIGQNAAYTAQNSANVTPSTASLSPAGPSDTSLPFTVVTGIQTDAYGNVVDSSITTKTITVVDTHAHPDDVDISVTSSNNLATATITVTDDDTQSAAGDLKVTTTGSVQVTGSNDTITLDIVWGTFNV